MKYILFLLPFYLFAPFASAQTGFEPNEEVEKHYIYVEANMSYDDRGRPRKPYLNAGIQAKEMLTHYHDLATQVETYRSMMDIVNYLDEQGFDFVDRSLFIYEDEITESVIMRKRR